MTDLELDDIQDIVAGYPRFAYARYLFLRFGAAENARAWVADLAAREITTADRSGNQSTSALNLALTWDGLAALGVAPETLATFPEEFRVGMAGRATRLGDSDTNDPRYWEPGGPGTTALHAVVLVHAATPEDLERRCLRVRDGFADVGEVVADQDGARLQDGAAGGTNPRKQLSREHFGFLDGISQPVIEGVKDVAPELLPGQGVRRSDGTWRALQAGEMILGYPDEEGVAPEGPTPPALARNGTYLVYRKLGQDVAAFRRLISEQGKHYPDGPEALAAKMVGRKPDGTPLALPDQNERPTADPLGRAFTYSDDLDGRKCPIGSHIRRANPRDGVKARDRLVHRHRILRRGISYGPPLPEGVLDDDGEQRGLLFVCLCASIARQFEFIQGQWVNDGNGLGLGNDQDPILSNSARGTSLTIPGEQPHFVSPIPPLIAMLGGEYFFLPGRRALTHLGGASMS
jgi:Dyp-type peroxidase family